MLQCEIRGHSATRETALSLKNLCGASSTRSPFGVPRLRGLIRLKAGLGPQTRSIAFGNPLQTEWCAVRTLRASPAGGITIAERDKRPRKKCSPAVARASCPCSFVSRASRPRIAGRMPATRKGKMPSPRGCTTRPPRPFCVFSRFLRLYSPSLGLCPPFLGKAKPGPTPSVGPPSAASHPSLPRSG